MGSTGSLVGFTVLVTALVACGLTGLVPLPNNKKPGLSAGLGGVPLHGDIKIEALEKSDLDLGN